MARLTRRGADGTASVEESSLHDAIQRLAGYEDYFEKLVSGQAAMEQELNQMRAQGKQKTIRFRELLGKKLLEAGLIETMRTHRID